MLAKIGIARKAERIGYVRDTVVSLQATIQLVGEKLCNGTDVSLK